MALNDDTASKGYPAAACGCLLLPIAACCSLLPMVVLLFVIGGTSVAANPKVPSLSGDSVNGGRLFSTFQPAAGIACSTCHRIDSQERLVGPGLLNVERLAEVTKAKEETWGKTFGRSLSLWYKARVFLATKSLTPSDTFDGVLDTRIA